MTGLPDFVSTRAYDAGPGAALSTAVVRRALNTHTTNTRVWVILQTAITSVERCDLSTHSMIPGYDLSDVAVALRAMLPLVEDRERLRLLDEWAADCVAEVVS